jgi:hypothetical protein
VFESHDWLFNWRGTFHAVASVLTKTMRDYVQNGENTFSFSHTLLMEPAARRVSLRNPRSIPSAMALPGRRSQAAVAGREWLDHGEYGSVVEAGAKWICTQVVQISRQRADNDCICCVCPPPFRENTGPCYRICNGVSVPSQVECISAGWEWLQHQPVAGRSGERKIRDR